MLSGESQWLYISPHSTSSAEFQFGPGERELWLNGDLNLEIQVHEDPDAYYGYGEPAGTTWPARAACSERLVAAA